MINEIHTQVVVIGAGPAGYSAAFRCADLGLEVTLINKYSELGGVCLNVGCIPSKCLLHFSKIITDIKKIKNNGIIFNDFEIDTNKIISWKNNIISKIGNGLINMSKIRKVNLIKGECKFINSHTISIINLNKIVNITFDKAIIATGSYPNTLKNLPINDNRIWNSTEALKLKSIPNRLLIIGGGIIGLEFATIYSSLGSKIDIIESNQNILPFVDEDISNFFIKQIKNNINIFTSTNVVSIDTNNKEICISLNKNNSTEKKYYDAILIAIGRKPNIENLNLNKIGVKINNNNFIIVNKQMQTNITHIYAIGDVVGQPMLAHKGIHEGHIAAEVISGMKHYFDVKVIPCIAYTNPEISWIGLTENEAKNKNINFESVIFPWSVLGKAVLSDDVNGITKLIIDKKHGTIIGGAIVGKNGSELLGEIGLAIEMNCHISDISLTIHAHPTLYESIGLAAQKYEGNITDMINSKKINTDNIFNKFM